MGYVLLIWEEVPEDTKLFLIGKEDVEPYLHFFKQAHNCYINGKGWQDDETGALNDGLRFLCRALSKEDSPEEGFDQYIGLFYDCKVDMSKPLLDQHITDVFHSGFIL